MIPFVHSAKVPSPIHAGFRGMQQAKLSTKMIKTPKRGKLGSSGRVEVSERKHLTSREVERLIEATKGGRNEIRDRCLLLLVFRHGLRVSEACGMKTGPGRYRKPRVACGPVEGRVSDDAALTQRRAEGYQRMAQRTRSDQADRQGVLCQ